MAEREGESVGVSEFVWGCAEGGERAAWPLTRAAHAGRYTPVAHATATAHAGRPGLGGEAGLRCVPAALGGDMPNSWAMFSCVK
jgi:hypothetical protein